MTPNLLVSYSLLDTLAEELHRTANHLGTDARAPQSASGSGDVDHNVDALCRSAGTFRDDLQTSINTTSQRTREAADDYHATDQALARN